MRCAAKRHNSGMGHVDVDGMRIAYQRAGSGPVLVMLHGAPTDSRTWRWMLPDLASDHTVIAWDAPGFGESSDIDDGWRAPQFADALASPARPGIGSTVLSATNAVGGNRATSTLRVPKTAPLSCELR